MLRFPAAVSDNHQLEIISELMPELSDSSEQKPIILLFFQPGNRNKEMFLPFSVLLPDL